MASTGIWNFQWHKKPIGNIYGGTFTTWMSGSTLHAEWSSSVQALSAWIGDNGIYWNPGIELIVNNRTSYLTDWFTYPAVGGYKNYVDGPVKSISYNANIDISKYMKDNETSANISVYAIIDCLDTTGHGGAGCSTDPKYGGPYRNVRISDSLSESYVSETGPYDPYNLSITYDSGQIKTSWADNLGTSTKQYDRMDIYVRANSNSDWVRVYWEDDDNCQAWKSYSVSPGTQMKFSVYTHSTSGKNSNTVWSGVYTVPGSLKPSGSVKLECTSKDSNLHVRGSYEVKASWSASGPLDSNPYSVTLWFEDSRGNTSYNNISDTSNTSRTHAIIPYNIGSRNNDVLKAKLSVTVRTYYYTPNQDGDATRHTTTTTLGTTEITIGTLVQFYAKIINSTTNSWARCYVITTNGAKENKYEDFYMKGAT